MDNQITNSSANFTTLFQQRMTQPPYNCDSCFNVSVGQYAAELADAVYLFATAFNRTLQQLGTTTISTHPSGNQLTANTHVEFDGLVLSLKTIEEVQALVAW